MMMKGPSKMTAEILKANGLSHYECRHCPSGRGYWEDHVPGPKHYNQISSLLGNRRIAEAKEELSSRTGKDVEYKPLLGDRQPPLNYRKIN